ncbi:unnamed protein product [Ambrosiozyma monospora]|uniref:Unnamed protein product n=1 Tax=Ambrosiozyma monospora TaxID=43982 RepID=A0A9W6Z2M7_AMBMO|nr:unnamed protein product [Ambrosiozyma monospora]
MSLELIKIGYVSHAMPDEGTPPFYGLANLQSTIRVFEDEIYVQNLHSKNNSLKKCIEDLYSSNVNMTHSLMYTRVPLSPDQKLSVDLTTDRMIALVVCMLDMSGFLALNSQSTSDDSFSNLIQMKSITKLYLGENLIYKKVEPTTGYIVQGTTKAKINIPLQTKYWSGAINDFASGAIDETHFENLRIVHSLIPDDDMVKLRIEKDQPIASFIWEFFANTIPSYVPHSVVVWKDIPIVDRSPSYWQQQQQQAQQQQQQRNFMMANNKRFSFAEPPMKTARSVSEHYGGPVGAGGRPVPVKTPVRGLGRGHKRTRSRSLNELDHLQHMQKPHSLLQQLQANRSVDTFDMNMNMMNGMSGSASINSRLSSAIGSPMSPRFVSPESISSAPPSQIQFNLGGGGGTPDSNSSYNDRIRFPGPQSSSAQQYNKYANMSVPNTPTMMHQQQQLQTQAAIFQQQQQQLSRNPSITATTITPQLQRFQFNDSNPTPTNSTTPIPNNTGSNSLTAEDLASLQPPPSRLDFSGNNNGNNTDHGSPTSTISAMSSSDSANDVGQLMQLQAAGNMFNNSIGQQPPSSTTNKSASASAFLFSQESFNTSTNSLVGVGAGGSGSQGIASPAAANGNNAGPSPSPLGNKVTNASAAGVGAGAVTPSASGDDVRFFFYKPPAPHN